MIESTIAKALLEDSTIAAYAGQKVFISSAPEGTQAPYIVVKASDSPDESDILADISVDIDIYDYREDQRPLRSVSRRIKNLLHYEKFTDPEGFYAAIRPFFESRTAMKEPDLTLVHVNMQFSVKAAELLT